MTTIVITDDNFFLYNWIMVNSDINIFKNKGKFGKENFSLNNNN